MPEVSDPTPPFQGRQHYRIVLLTEKSSCAPILQPIAEMVGAKSGLGFMIWNAWETLSVETMYVGLIVIAMLGIISTLVLNEIERFLVPWKTR